MQVKNIYFIICKYTHISLCIVINSLNKQKANKNNKNFLKKKIQKQEVKKIIHSNWVGTNNV